MTEAKSERRMSVADGGLQVGGRARGRLCVAARGSAVPASLPGCQTSRSTMAKAQAQAQPRGAARRGAARRSAAVSGAGRSSRLALALSMRGVVSPLHADDTLEIMADQMQLDEASHCKAPAERRK